MSNKREALEAAITTLQGCGGFIKSLSADYSAIEPTLVKLRAALAEPEQEPAIYAVFAWGRLENTYYTRDSANLIRDAYRENACASVVPLYASPREWQELSEDEKNKLYLEDSFCAMRADWDEEYKAISAALRAKNGG